jgi:hypothetical protein
MAKGRFATAINCMDGRTQLPVIHYMMAKYQVQYVDSITEPGPAGILAQGQNERLLDSIRRRVEISVNAHGSRHIAVVGHEDCAGNPVEKKVHLQHVLRSVERICSWGLPCEVIGLWVDADGSVRET